LRIIILNNSGGNIFRIIPGPDQTEQLAKHFEAHHSTCAKDIAGAHGIRYLSVHDPDSLKKGLVDLFGSEIQEPMILEVFTPRFINDKVLKQYFQSLT
jgi:2-succinyl-5-enolpyruvyl-6-hydroxy-3-cyclohexene-1-carboxylate synthase